MDQSKKILDKKSIKTLALGPRKINYSMKENTASGSSNQELEEQETGLTRVNTQSLSGHKAFPPEQLYTMAKMGYTQWEYGKLDRARAIFQTLVLQRPDEPWFHTALGSIYQREKQYTQALQQYNIALDLNPKDIPSRVNRGEILLKIGKQDDGVGDLLVALKGDPSGKHPSALRAKALLTACRRQLK